MRDYRYRVDREGRVFHDGTEVVDPTLLRFFLRTMTRAEDGRFLVVCQGERNWFEAEDSPFVVQRIEVSGRANGGGEVWLGLAGGYREILDPGTLENDGGRPFCRVRGGTFRAGFGRIALQQLAPLLTDGADGPSLMLGRHRHPIRDRAVITP